VPVGASAWFDRRGFLRGVARGAALAALPAGLCRCSRPVPRATGPNLLYIMADDLGYADLGSYGRQDYRTPALDGFAAESIRLTQAYSAGALCSPTRVALMTGRYPARLAAGLYEPLTTEPTGLAPEHSVLARGLKTAGYETALIGKWHLGVEPEYHPFRHGFDEFYGFLGAAVDYVSHLGTEHLRHDLYDGTRPIRPRGYLTDLLTDRAVGFLSRPRQRPFFLSLQYNAPHWPWQAPGDPPYPDSLRWSKGGSAATFARMMESLDRGVGRVLEALRASGVERKTLVIFTSDNGGERYSDMGPLSEGKATLWEGGIRVAAIARWPGVVPAGTTTDQVAITMDWTRTLLAAGGAAAPPAVLDGIDLLPSLRGAAPAPRELFWRMLFRSRARAVRRGDWKYLAIDDGERLFDLRADPGETRDLAAAAPDVLESLKAAYVEWEASVLPPSAATDSPLPVSPES
jgi:arylsulfatase A-like enzyme